MEDRPASVGMWRYVAAQTALLDDRGAALSDQFGAGGRGLLTGRRGCSSSRRRAPSAAAGHAVCCAPLTDGLRSRSPRLADDLTAIPAWLDGRIDEGDALGDPWTLVEEQVSSRSAVELVERGALLGLACSVIGEQTDRRRTIVESIGSAPAAAGRRGHEW